VLPDPAEQLQVDRLPREFFDRPATVVGPDLLGCVLWYDSPEGLVAVRLVEVEAYMGPDDPASHSYRGQTARNAVMFGPPGILYVYFTYGMHFCANLVCQPPGRPEAVLLRAGEVVAGAELAARRRAADRGRSVLDGAAASGARDPRRIREVDLARGPARLCQALDIDRRLDGTDACAAGSPVGIGSGPATTEPIKIETGPRVGVSQAADRPWRYWLAGDHHVSVYRPSKPRHARLTAVRSGGGKDGTMHR
jgi:DNA-3-methyladenine glycosylase